MLASRALYLRLGRRLALPAITALALIGGTTLVGVATADTTPAMTVTPAVVAPGGTVTAASVTPCNPNEQVAAYLNGPTSTTKTDGVADASGAWRIPVTVPPGTPPATYTIYAACSPLGSFRLYPPVPLTVKLAVTLTADPVLRTVPNLVAHLSTTADAQPVAGAPLAFTTTSGAPICQATTNTAGTASCSGFLNALLSLGYRVTYAGDATHLNASAQGSIL
jgi:hypothetical protein